MIDNTLAYGRAAMVQGWTPLGGEPRLEEVTLRSATPEQRCVLEAILAGPRTSLSGPFLSWIHSPVLADHAQKLGAFCRYGTGLPTRQSELAILVTAARWEAHAEWQIHLPIALEAGVPLVVADAVREGRAPPFDDADDALVFTFAQELYTSRRVSDRTYRETVARWGEQRTVNLVGLLGYYALVAMTLNVFNVSSTE